MSEADLTRQTPKSLAIADAGIRNLTDFRNCMSAVISDLIGGRITPETATAVATVSIQLYQLYKSADQAAARY